jgi:hypothetical protein
MDLPNYPIRACSDLWLVRFAGRYETKLAFVGRHVSWRQVPRPPFHPREPWTTLTHVRDRASHRGTSADGPDRSWLHAHVYVRCTPCFLTCQEPSVRVVPRRFSSYPVTRVLSQTRGQYELARWRRDGWLLLARWPAGPVNLAGSSYAPFGFRSRKTTWLDRELSVDRISSRSWERNNVDTHSMDCHSDPTDGNGYQWPAYPSAKNPIEIRVWDKILPMNL